MLCLCNNQMQRREIYTQVVNYCEECSTYALEYLNCSHEKSVPIRLEIADGRYMIKMWCSKCGNTHGNALKFSDYKGMDIHTTTNKAYYDYQERRTADERELIDNIIAGKTLLSIAIRQREFEQKRELYGDYLNSQEWKEKRRRAMARDNGTCQICLSPAQQVHHLTYAHIGKEYLFELVSLCEKCHKEHYHADKLKPVKL